MEDVQISLPDDEVYFNKPSLVLRIKSMLLDGMCVIVLMMLIFVMLENFEIVSENARKIGAALVILYEPILITLGGTIGQRLMGLRVRNFSRYKRNKSIHNLNIYYSLVRYIIKILLGWVSLLTIHTSAYGQAIHDKFGNSIMTFRQ